jgi:hypothetical protein
VSFAQTFEILTLKSRARHLYRHIQRRSDLSCGAHLTDFIRPDIAKAEREFETVVARLREIDPSAPLTSAHRNEDRK